MDYYQILQLNRNASPEEIKQSYRKLALLYHPDKNGGDEEQFKQLHAAYQILRDPMTRKEYDESVSSNTVNDNFQMYMDFFDTMVSPLLAKWKEVMENKKTQENDILQKNAEKHKNTHENFAKSGKNHENATCEKCVFSQKKQKTQNGTNVEMKQCIRLKLVVSLSDLYDGTTKKVVYKTRSFSGSVTKYVLVPLCSGKKEYVFPGEGDEIDPGIYGDVCVYLEVTPHEVLQISPTNHRDLHMVYPVTLFDIYYGIDVEVPYFDEVIHLRKSWFHHGNLTLPDDHTDMILEMQDRGLPYEENDEVKYGNLYVFFKLQLPKLPKWLLNSYEFKNGIKKFFKHNEE